MALFESYERRIDQINAVLNSYGISSLEEAEKITKDAGLDVYNQIKGIQPICFENACWAYIVGAAIAIYDFLIHTKIKTNVEINAIFVCKDKDSKYLFILKYLKCSL